MSFVMAEKQGIVVATGTAAGEILASFRTEVARALRYKGTRQSRSIV
jgi:hypothetical protein